MASAPIEKEEAALKSAFMAVADHLLYRLQFVLIRHEDVRTSGIPDLSVTGLGKTSWYEFKHATPYFESPGQQELMLMRLAQNGYARYIIWRDLDGHRSTNIVNPVELFRRGREGQRAFVPQAFTTGYDHAWLAQQILRTHQEYV